MSVVHASDAFFCWIFLGASKKKKKEFIVGSAGTKTEKAANQSHCSETRLAVSPVIPGIDFRSMPQS